MKKLIILLFAAMLAMSASAATILSPFACGTITYRDGHSETYEKVELPHRNAKKLMAKAEGAKMSSVLAQDILYITYWTNKNPQSTYTIYCLHMEYESGKKTKVWYDWGVPYMSSEKGVVFRCYESYAADEKKGEFRTVVTVQETSLFSNKVNLEYWQPLVLLRKDAELGIKVAVIRNYTDRKTKERVAEFSWPSDKAELGAENFKDNPELYQQILDGTLKASDLQYILDQL